MSGYNGAERRHEPDRRYGNGRPGRSVNVITVSVLVTSATLIGFGAGVGWWGGDLSRIVLEHERRLNAQDNHMERIDDVATNTASRLSSIEASIQYLIRRAEARERTQLEIP